MTALFARLARLSMRARLVIAVLAWTGLGTGAIWLAATMIASDN